MYKHTIKQARFKFQCSLSVSIC